MKIKCVKGTRDYLPEEARLREEMQSIISEIYRKNGYQRIMTPAVEDAENLDKSDGGENLNLIFKILKRGEKLNAALEKNPDANSLCDLGLRYDLTLPLTRYFAANRQQLPMPFKAIQMDKVYRAENPQKGRLREFMQCDIDVIGDASPECETELIAVTAKALKALDIGDFTVRINDRRVLNSLLLGCGFGAEELASVCISFDKLDKIGAEGVVSELREKNFGEDAVNKFAEILGNLPLSFEKVRGIVGEDADNLAKIIEQSEMIADGKYNIEFDVSLVRGQGYYTGTIFEVKSEKFGSSVAGGGRYDKLIGKFIGEDVPACGFSIGFERIFSILSENGRACGGREKLAMLYDEDFEEAYRKAEELREKYDVSLFRRPKKMKAFLDRLLGAGYAGFASENENKEIQIKFFNG